MVSRPSRHAPASSLDAIASRVQIRFLPSVKCGVCVCVLLHLDIVMTSVARFADTEFLGTMILILVGLGSVVQTVLGDGKNGSRLKSGTLPTACN